MVQVELRSFIQSRNSYGRFFQGNTFTVMIIDVGNAQRENFLAQTGQRKFQLLLKGENMAHNTF